MSSTSSPEAAAPASADVDLAAILRHIWTGKLLLITCLGGMLLVALIYLAVTPPIYEATALVEVKTQPPLLPIADPSRESGDPEQLLNTIERKLQRQALYQKVMKHAEPHWMWKGKFGGTKSLGAYEPAELASMLAANTRIQIQRKTRLIAIKVRHNDPEVASDLANGIFDEFSVEQQIGRARLLDEALYEVQAQREVILERLKFPSIAQSEATADRELLSQLTLRVKELQLLSDVSASPVTLVDPASEPISPVEPDKAMVLLGSLVIGGFLGLFLIWALTLFKPVK